MKKSKKISKRKKAKLHKQLRRAAHKGDHQALMKLVATPGVDLDAVDRNGNSALHEAARLRHVDDCELLVGNGAQINLQNKNNETPLCIYPMLMEILHRRFADGVYVGIKRTVRSSIEQGVDLNWPIIRGMHEFRSNIYPLQLVAAKKYTHMVRFLLDHGASLIYCNARGTSATYTPEIGCLLLSHIPKCLIHKYIKQMAIPFLFCCKRAKEGEAVSAMGLMPREIRKLICLYCVSSCVLHQQLYRASVVCQTSRHDITSRPFQLLRRYHTDSAHLFDPDKLMENYGAEWEMQIANYFNGR